MILGFYFAPDFRGGARNKKFACVVLSRTEERAKPSLSIQAVVLASTRAL